MMTQAPSSWNPHLKLEYLKMCIRTTLEKVQAERKVQERSEEYYLNHELDHAIKSLEKENVGVNYRAELIDHIESKN